MSQKNPPPKPAPPPPPAVIPPPGEFQKRSYTVPPKTK